MLEMANRRAKRSEIWDSGVLVEHIWDTFGPVMFNVSLGSFGAHAVLPKILQTCFF